MQWNGSFYGFEQLGRVVRDAVLEDELHFANIGDPVGGVAVDDDEVGMLAGGDRADAVLLAEELRAVGRGDPDGFDGRESAFDEELDVAEIGETGEGASVAGRVGAGDEEAAGFGEGAL